MVPMLLVAAAIGFIGALAVESFRFAMAALIHLYSRHEHLVAVAADLPLWARVVVPPLGAAAGGLLMWAGAEAKWLLTAAGGAGCVLGGLVVWAQRRHLRAWSKRHNIE